MEILTRHSHSAMDPGIIDEWRVSDFTRSQEDHEWVTREFGPVRPELLDRPTAIYSDFAVSHLSFRPQEQGPALDHLIGAYDELMRSSIAAQHLWLSLEFSRYETGAS